MAITDPLVLPTDVVLVPVAELPRSIREQFTSEEGDYALTRPLSRVPSKIIDAEAAALIGEFKTPKTIVEAIINYSRERSSDPEKMLEESLPLIQSLMHAGLLVQSDSLAATEITASFQPGEQVEEFHLCECVQVLDDTEVYLAERDNGERVALKIARLGHRPGVIYLFAREAAILKQLDGRVNPALIREGTWQDRLYLALEWCDGVAAPERAEEFRQAGGPATHGELLKLCCAVVNAYAHLHAQNVLHGDIHPRNILVDSDGSIKILDYGLARLEGATSELGLAGRGGVGAFFEPEYAAAIRAGSRPPQTSRAGEQYSIAALLYLILTGSFYYDFSLENDVMLRQIVEEHPLPFAQRGIPPWPAVEQILAQALSKNPAERFASLEEFGARLGAVSVPDDRQNMRRASAGARTDQRTLEQLTSEVLHRVSLEGPLLPLGVSTAPTVSINYGGAGVAYALYRIACCRSDASLLSLADIWATRALQDMDKSTAFYNPEIEITPEMVGRTSLYHSPSGVHAVRALIAQALGDISTHVEATLAFINASSGPCENLDLTLGRSSTLLGCSLLFDARPANQEVEKVLLEFGSAIMQGIWDRIGQYAAIRECREIDYLGIAHGWAGILYATLRWHQSSGTALPLGFDLRLSQLAELAEPRGRGARWKWMLHSQGIDPRYNYMPGWCNGSAGHVHLWTLAYDVLHEGQYLELAEQAAWDTVEGPDTIGNLCCGGAGQAYALLNLYRHTGAKEWLDRARALASQAPHEVQAMSMMKDSLYKGEVGIAVLATDLAVPERASMPCFEAEGWPRL